jgi:hypothetical protein
MVLVQKISKAHVGLLMFFMLYKHLDIFSSCFPGLVCSVVDPDSMGSLDKSPDPGGKK